MLVIAPPASIAFIGDEYLVLQCASIARSAGHRVAVVASRFDQIRERATQDDFNSIDPAGLQEFLAADHVDVLFSIANEFVLPAELLAHVDLAINFHDGPLPDYAGLAVTTWALFNGENEHAITWHTMTPDVDAGDVVYSERFDISPAETAFSLNARCYEEGLTSFPRVLSLLGENDRGFDQQPNRVGEWFGRYQRPLAFLDPSKPAIELARSVRSLDLGPRIRNRVGTVRLVLADSALVVSTCEAVPSNGQPMGTVSRSEDGVRIATIDGDLVVTGATTLTGDAVDLDDVHRSIGDTLESPSLVLVETLVQSDEELARSETFWTSRLMQFERSEPTHLQGAAQGGWLDLEIPIASGMASTDIATGVLVWWSRTSGTPTTWFGFSDEEVGSSLASLGVLGRRPLGRFSLGDHLDWASAREAVRTEFQLSSERGPFLSDLIARNPDTRHLSIDPALSVTIGTADRAAPANSLVDAVIPPTGGALNLRIRDSVAPEVARRCAAQLTALLSDAMQRPTDPIVELDVVGDEERQLFDQWNDTARPFDRRVTVDGQFRMQAAATPNLPAVSCAATTLTYGELQSAVDVFATELRAVGAERGSLIGIALDRDVDLLVAVLAVLSLGAAYVPLDPSYPEDRLAHMVSDSGLTVLVGRDDTAARLSARGVAVVTPGQATEPQRHAPPTPEHSPDDLAYVIYTSGSTGRPKGVMLEHRNVVNFFAAMDDVIDHEQPGTWLAVTSLSFDISVLELLWTVTRGFHVVIQKHGITSPHAPVSAIDALQARSRPTSLSLFFFAAGDAQATDGYRLLRECAQFADTHGFEAIWLPERHFHAFGGAYPNPSVLASAVAVLTNHVHIRAGSVVLPLHSSARVAEEWSVVDNISGGRVGISFAPGWQPNDFVLNPTGYATAREDLEGRIDEVRALWRGDAVQMVGPDGALVDVRTLPRPIQPELPLWLTSAGTTKTFQKAGEMGLNLLTHLLGQSIDELAANIEVYREAWCASGHVGEGHVTVMLHTFLDPDRERSLRLAEDPMKRYLGSAAGLLKNMASAFPTFAKAGASADEAFQSLSDAEMDELMSMAAARYLHESGLFGNLDDASEMALALSSMGVDEIACLVDFGLDTDDVLGSLPLLGELQSALEPSDSATMTNESAHTDLSEAFADLVERHSVTHVQCTPSLAAMLMADPRDQVALGSIQHLMVGGEALPEKLGRELRGALSGRLTNMYGPTETTIWSLVHELAAPIEGPIPIGHAIANTTIHILDPHGQRLPIGALGELHIGGDGVARGYLGRDDLTAERFVDRPGLGRLYATGDLARIDECGVVEFAGRVDFQVKIRGHRIELGEVETQLDLHPTVDRSVVVARGDAASARLVAFVVLVAGADLDATLLRQHVASALPDVMVPDVIASLATLPLTPNGKVDRTALPANIEQSSMAAPAAEDAIAPENDLELLVAAAWTEQLDRAVGRTENFFDIGGNSLLAVAVFRRLQESTGFTIALTDIFRYPTVAQFADYLRRLDNPDENRPSPNSATPTGVDRGARRRKMLEGRRG